MPPTVSRPYPVDLLLCGHHYWVSRPRCGPRAPPSTTRRAYRSRPVPAITSIPAASLCSPARAARTHPRPRTHGPRTRYRTGRARRQRVHHADPCCTTAGTAHNGSPAGRLDHPGCAHRPLPTAAPRPPVLADGAQLAPHRPLPADADFLAWSGYKMYAPFGTGVLVGPRRVLADGDPFPAGLAVGGAADPGAWTRPCGLFRRSGRRPDHPT